MIYSFSWTSNNPMSTKSGLQRNPDWEGIYFGLKKLEFYAGTATLNVLDNIDIGLIMLQVRAEKGFYFLAAGELTVDDYRVREYSNSKVQGNLINILGDSYPLRVICEDFGVVIDVFRQFYETGYISQDILS